MTLCSTLRISFLFLFFTTLPYLLLVPERYKREPLLDDPFLQITMDDPMIDWFKGGVTQLYQQDAVQGEKEQPNLLGSIFDENAHLVLNHKPISLSEYSDSLSQSFLATTKTDVEWKTVLSQRDEGEAQETIVTGYFVIARYMKFRIRAAPAQTLQHCIFSAKIRTDAANEGEEGSHRISEMFITSIYKQAPIHIASIPTS